MAEAHRMQLSCDRQADMRDSAVGAPVAAISREIGDGVLLRLSPETGAVVGLTARKLSTRAHRDSLLRC